jgi:SAM-dependent methyltransferase
MNNAKEKVRSIAPAPIWKTIRLLNQNIRMTLLYHNWRVKGHPKREGESFKAKERRMKEGFFEKYCKGKGLDIGFGGDLLSVNCRGWDIEHGDAQFLHGLKDSKFDFVYSSHTLEHLDDPSVALTNWWRVLKNGGFMILYIPHRDLFEKKKTLPSRWNPGHKHFFLLDKNEEPDTLGLTSLIQDTLSDFKIIYARTCDYGHTITDPKKVSDGEYSIEVVVKKLQ